METAARCVACWRARFEGLLSSQARILCVAGMGKVDMLGSDRKYVSESVVFRSLVELLGGLSWLP